MVCLSDGDGNGDGDGDDDDDDEANDFLISDLVGRSADTQADHGDDQYRPPQAGDRVLVCIRPAGRCRSTRPNLT